MRKVKIRHRRLAGVGDLFELDAASGSTITVISHRSGRSDIAIGKTGDEPSSSTGLTRTEAAAVALLLSGANVELETIRD
jgi:K+/H+ antiporter YhaU regulatory subunit KhtT